MCYTGFIPFITANHHSYHNDIYKNTTKLKEDNIMPVIGEQISRKPGSMGYAHDPMANYAKEFLNLTTSILEEARLDLYEDTSKVLRKGISDESMKQFFMENSCDPKGMSAEELEDHMVMMEQMYENDKQAVLEHCGMGQYNPVIGMTFPIHKNIMLNNIFDKGAIPKFVATSPKFTVSMETRWLIDPETNEKIDMWREQYKMTDAIDKAAPLKTLYLPLPETENTNIIETLFGVPADHNTNLSIESYLSGLIGSKVVFPAQTIKAVVSLTDTANPGVTTYDIVTYTNTTTSAVIVSATSTPSDFAAQLPAYDTTVTATLVGGVFDWRGPFAPAYGGYDRQICEQFALPTVTAVAAGTLPDTWALTVTLANGSTVTIDNATSEDAIPGQYRTVGFISGFAKNNRFGLTSSNATVGGVLLTSRLDTSSAMLKTASVSWDVRTDIIEIPNAIPINVTIAPEEVKDIAALYQINQLTKVMSLMKISLGNYKDDKIRRFMDQSFLEMPADSKIARQFDFAPSQNYALDPIEWRHKTFMDALDTHATQLLHVLNDPNVTFNIIGRDDLIRKITPTDYTYQTPSAIGPVQLDFVKTVCTSDKRTYQFISSDKLRDTNNLMIIVCPRNSERFIYRIYDYQMYLSNEIRNITNPALPAVHAFERWIIKHYQPVQGRIRILNPTGLRNYGTDYAYNNDPTGRGDGVKSIGKNDFNIDAI